MISGKLHPIQISEPVDVLESLVELLKLRRTAKTTIKINVTRHMLERAQYADDPNIHTDCVVARILRRYFPHATIGYSASYHTPVAEVNYGDFDYIPLPKDMSDFILKFDSLIPNERIGMKPTIFY